MEPGHRLEHYVLIEQIGRGGQAVVWSADDERLKRLVAIKTINPKPTEGSSTGSGSGSAGTGSGSATSPDELAHRFQDEAQIIADLEHPGILPIYTFGQDGETLYIVMRYMAGGSLKGLLESGPLDLSQTVKLIRPVADALDLAHQRKIIHRDIKSANVLLDARHNLYLADFGLSVTLGDSSQPGGGTLAYMSPEQMMGDAVDHRSDLYAFGILLYEMLTGKLPVMGGQPWNIQQVMVSAPMPIPDDMAPGVAEVLRKATSLKADDRYNSATEIVEALARNAKGDGSDTAGGGAELPVTDPALQALKKANVLFDDALLDWADGAGRFHLYAEDFQFIDSFYSDAAAWGIHLDAAAHRMMLRAALEHGYEVDVWWNAIEHIGERRGIALQTLTSELAPARLRAMHYLAQVGDSHPPAIPTRVAAILEREPEADVRRAGVALLEAQGKVDSTASHWRAVAFSETIDSTLVEIAAHDPDPGVAEAAARACARLGSAFAVKRLAGLAAFESGGDVAAFRALTFIRDEVPALPSEITAITRLRVFAVLSLRQICSWSLLWRFLAAAVGFLLGWGAIQFLQYTGRDLLPLQALGNAIASGITYSLLAGLAVAGAAEPARLLRAWSRPGRIALSFILGTLLWM
ncbi:MAG TPA: serine/threonine-protein kinase, partial [Aggregatilineales bacterium]|nr:serine/threonine-protein kinase [Aggregatilineales bacterium]